MEKQKKQYKKVVLEMCIRDRGIPQAAQQRGAADGPIVLPLRRQNVSQAFEAEPRGRNAELYLCMPGKRAEPPKPLRWKKRGWKYARQCRFTGDRSAGGG